MSIKMPDTMIEGFQISGRLHEMTLEQVLAEARAANTDSLRWSVAFARSEFSYDAEREYADTLPQGRAGLIIDLVLGCWAWR